MNGIESKMIGSQEKLDFPPENPIRGLLSYPSCCFSWRCVLEMSSFFNIVIVIMKEKTKDLHLQTIWPPEENYVVGCLKWIGLSPFSTFLWSTLSSREKHNSLHIIIKNKSRSHLACFNNKENHTKMTFQRIAISKAQEMITSHFIHPNFSALGLRLSMSLR